TDQGRGTGRMGREIAAEVAARAREQFGRSAAGRAPLEHGLEHAVGGGALAGEQRPGAEVGAGVVLERIGPAVSEEPQPAVLQTRSASARQRGCAAGTTAQG